MQDLVIAVDVGGSSVKSGIVAPQQQVSDITTTPINAQGDKETILETFTQIIRDHMAQYDAERMRGVAFGFPGIFDYANAICLIQGVAKYDSIYGVNIRDALRQRLDQPDLDIRFRNDAEAAIIGEAKYGAGQLYSRIIGLTLGTGMGSSFIVDGRRMTDIAGAPDEGFLFSVDYKGRQADDTFSTRGLLERFKQSAILVNSVAAAKTSADAGDAQVVQAFREFGSDLGEFLTPFVVDFQPQAVLLLGGIARAGDYFIPALQAALPQDKPINVHTSILDTEAALLGAADLFD